jgi:hypothetical protein
MRKTSLFLLSAVSALSAATLLAENAVLLEGFEDNIDSAAQGTWGGVRIPDDVALTQYTKAGADDINVTQGTKSLQVDLTGSEGWVHDFMVTLSEEASAKVREAANSTDVARYILRYDLVFPGGTSWMNNQAFLGNVNNQLNSPNAANGGKTTMSWALDLVEGLPEEGPIILRFADNFDATEDPFAGPLTLYVDNIRLVDTYAPGATPVITLLQGFEDAANPTGGAADFTAWGGTPRTTYEQYTKEGADDIKVTEGTKSLKVDVADGGWKADFTVPFPNTKLAEVLKLDLPEEERPTAAELERYTLRFDLIFQDRDENGKPAWASMSQFAYNGSSYPYSENRRDAAEGRVQTVSITLDQVPNWVADPEGAPALVLVHQGDFDAPWSMYYDNFRLIDTGATGGSTPGPEVKISSVQYNASTSAVTLRWSSAAGKTYAIDYTQNLGSWPTVLAPSIQSAGDSTTYTGTVPTGARGFLRVRPTN